ncbi:6484_t:CDS:10 [Acaulospora colombiana]|uniref:6484_t:CDS:1 n=1 Tax=Acaulospora colombiana TaxID=27376 RepID=A0ACA9MNF8_9GLOM|nr:6484_t:CDS:10 [Acaulospora colombiana]
MSKSSMNGGDFTAAAKFLATCHFWQAQMADLAIPPKNRVEDQTYCAVGAVRRPSSSGGILSVAGRLRPINLSTIRPLAILSTALLHRAMSNMCEVLPTTRPEWQKALDSLPTPSSTIPAFFFAHGLWPKAIAPSSGPFAALYKDMGPEGTLSQFLQDFGKTLRSKYDPRAVVVFSAHWESPVSDYGAENPLLMDYYGFPRELYQVKFKSRGDSSVAQDVVQALKDAGISARTTPITESRGEDGRGFSGPGLDHGVFVPFKHMFGDELDIPLVQVSIDGSLDPAKQWALGKAVKSLRSQKILVLSGGLTFHNLRDFSGFNLDTAKPALKDFHNAILSALQISDVSDGVSVLCSPNLTWIPLKQTTSRQEALYALTKHPGLRASHPREDHFVPLYVAAGAGDGEELACLAKSEQYPPALAFVLYAFMITGVIHSAGSSDSVKNRGNEGFQISRKDSGSVDRDTAVPHRWKHLGSEKIATQVRNSQILMEKETVSETKNQNL